MMNSSDSSPDCRKIQKKHKNWELPDFTLDELRLKKHSYCICVFVINEGKRVQKQLKQMQKYAKQIDIIVADGGSRDGSLEIPFLRSVNVRALLTKKGPGKLSAQMRMAFAYALDQGYQGVVIIDGNGKDGVSAIPNFIKLLDKGYDHIQGSRFIKGGHAINTPIERHIAVRVLHSPLISLASRHYHSDTTNGFRAYSSKLLADPQIAVFRDIFQTYELHYHLAIESARAKKFKLTETPVARTYPAKGKIPTKISPVKGNAHILGILFKAVAGKYRMPTQQD